jgi:hypothetical protein
MSLNSSSDLTNIWGEVKNWPADEAEKFAARHGWDPATVAIE